MSAEEKIVVQSTLDLLGKALTDYDHVWTKTERHLYERATAILRKDNST